MSQIFSRLLYLFLLLFSSLAVKASDTTRVLFIGNSFTYVNMVPDLVKGLAQQGNIQLQYAMHAPGGATVGDSVQGDYAHMENPEVFALIRQGNWDYVVVQDNQGRFLYDYGVFKPSARTIEGHKRLMDSTRYYNSCATMIWFCGWAFKDGAPPYGNTGIALIDRIDANYKFMNDSLSQLVSPIGAAWKRSVLSDPGTDLWDTDGAHASLNGSYLTAAVLFSSIFKRDPGPLAFNGGLDAAKATTFRQIAYQVFTDSFARNNEETFTLPLNYTSGTLTTTAGYTSYDYYKEGQKIAGIPGNTYAVSSGGCYQVIAKDNGGCRHFSKELCFNLTGLSELAAEEPFSVYPNPVHDLVRIRMNRYHNPVAITLYDLQGKLIYQTIIQQQEYSLSLTSIPAGTYILRLQSGAQSWKTSLLKR